MRPNANRPQRRRLPHGVPHWVDDDAVFFVTICAEPRGTNQLCHETAAAGLWGSVLFRQELQQRYALLFLLMPDHLHALVVLPPDGDLAKTVGAWKRYAALQFAVTWQRNFFDHRLRSDESLREKELYIRESPVRAGPVSDAAAWPYVRPGEREAEIG